MAPGSASRSQQNRDKLRRLRKEIADNFYAGLDGQQHQHQQHHHIEEPVADVIELCTKMGDVSTLSDSAFMHEYFEETTAQATPLRRSNTIRSIENAYDSDDDIPPREVIALDRLSWRHKPEISLFDWKIDVVTTVQEDSSSSRQVYIYSDTFKADPNVSICPCVEVVPAKRTKRPRATTTYHVHKNMLAMGPRRSEFFARMFLQGQGNHRGTYSRRNRLTTRMEVPPMVAKEFPNLLDYLYTPELMLTLTTENAAALYYLAKFLDIRTLRHETKQFWEKDVRSNSDKWMTYYEHAKILRDDKILKVAIECCVDHGFLNLDSYSLLLKNVEFWLDVVRNVKVTTELSIRLSQLMATYLAHNFGLVTPEIFTELTAARHLPYLHIDSVLPLMAVEREILQGAENNHQKQQKQPSYDGGISDFQNRCIETLVSNWNTIDMQDPCTMNILAKQNPLVLTKLLSGSLTVAQTANHELAAQKQALKVENTELRAAQHSVMQKRNTTFNTDRHRLALRRERLRRERDGRLKEVSACFHDLSFGDGGPSSPVSSSSRNTATTVTTTTASRSPGSPTSNESSRGSRRHNSMSTSSRLTKISITDTCGRSAKE